MPQDSAVASVLFVMALGLETRSVWNAVRRPTAAILAFTVNLGLVPPLAWLAGRLIDTSLAEGMIVAATVPCTQASAAVWTRRAGGNPTIAVLTTMTTSLACFVVTPAWLELLVGRPGGSGKSFGALMLRLGLVVALPIVVGQLLRAIPRIRAFAVRRAFALGLYTQIGILSMVFVGAVECGQQLHQLEGGVAPLAGHIAAMIVLVAAVHTVAWFSGYGAGHALGVPRDDTIGVAFAGSQKTLMVGLAIAIDFGGLAVLPMVAYHVEQLIIDTVLAERLRARGKTPPP
jgi:solute carrier family 10 (sodium/bile acid cotransporter), member 7